MKVTRLGPPKVKLSLVGILGGSAGPGEQVPTSNGSNGVAWGSNIATAWSNGSNQILGPHINFASGSNVTFAVASNTLTIHATGGSGSLTVADEGTPLATSATTLDFVGAGVTASGTGATKTITISGGGGGGTFPLGLAAADTIPASPGTYDEEWEGAADTLPSGWSWIGSAPATVKINSRYESLFVLERPASNGSTYELRRDTFAPGAIDFGLWWKWAQGIGLYNNNGNWMDCFILDSAEAEGQGFRFYSTGTHEVRQVIASSESSTGNAIPLVESAYGWAYGGLTRTSAGVWRAWVSTNGIGWTAFSGALSHAVTADRFRFRFNSGNNPGPERNILDWVRYRTDLEFPRP